MKGKTPMVCSVLVMHVSVQCQAKFSVLSGSGAFVCLGGFIFLFCFVFAG